jgi:hypothetical protein
MSCITGTHLGWALNYYHVNSLDRLASYALSAIVTNNVAHPLQPLPRAAP